MQNPSQGVAAQLQQHVHLISAHKFALSAQLSMETAFRYLLDAPIIVKQVAPMSWQYVAAPQDGTMWLEWIPQERVDYPSDGYMWGDPEQTYRQDFSGYSMELKVNKVGFRPGLDQFATHARTRYHFVAKSPTVNAAPPDPQLWIVHYHQSDSPIPSTHISASAQMKNVLAQRQWIEAQGTLERREFMLHDRDHWPTLGVPGQMQQQPYGASMAAGVRHRYPQQAGPQPGGQPPNKKARMSGPGMAMPGSSDGPHEVSIEIEEDTALGDFFDHLTQRDISLARYMQHHRWMEEVFSSPYASSQIVPPDLGLGLMGELKGLTDGILVPPNLDFHEHTDVTVKPKEAEAFTNLKKEQVQEFEKRVAKHIQEGQAEIERMKAEHAAKMQDWKKFKALTQAEKRLRYATWEGHENAMPAYRLEEPTTNEHEQGLGKEHVEDVVKDVENLLKTKITSHQDATRIAKGGLQDRKPQVYDYERTNNQQDTTMDGMGNEHAESTTQPGANTNVSEPTTYRRDPTAVTQTTGAKAANAMSHAGFDGQQMNTPGADGNQGLGDNSAGEALEDLPEMDMNDTLMEGMDMDMDGSNINFDANPDDVDETTRELEAAGVVASRGTAQEAASSLPTVPTMATSGQSGNNQSNAEGTSAGVGEDSMFNDTFDDLTNIEGIDDFGGDGMMDGSAFGDAIHGMDAPEGGDDAGPSAGV